MLETQGQAGRGGLKYCAETLEWQTHLNEAERLTCVLTPMPMKSNFR